MDGAGKRLALIAAEDLTAARRVLSKSPANSAHLFLRPASRQEMLKLAAFVIQKWNNRAADQVYWLEKRDQGEGRQPRAIPRRQAAAS